MVKLKKVQEFLDLPDPNADEETDDEYDSEEGEGSSNWVTDDGEELSAIAEDDEEGAEAAAPEGPQGNGVDTVSALPEPYRSAETDDHGSMPSLSSSETDQEDPEQPASGADSESMPSLTSTESGDDDDMEDDQHSVPGLTQSESDDEPPPLWEQDLHPALSAPAFVFGQQQHEQARQALLSSVRQAFLAPSANPATRSPAPAPSALFNWVQPDIWPGSVHSLPQHSTRSTPAADRTDASASRQSTTRSASSSSVPTSPANLEYAGGGDEHLWHPSDYISERPQPAARQTRAHAQSASSLLSTIAAHAAQQHNAQLADVVLPPELPALVSSDTDDSDEDGEGAGQASGLGHGTFRSGTGRASGSMRSTTAQGTGAGSFWGPSLNRGFLNGFGGRHGSSAPTSTSPSAESPRPGSGSSGLGTGTATGLAGAPPDVGTAAGNFWGASLNSGFLSGHFASRHGSGLPASPHSSAQPQGHTAGTTSHHPRSPAAADSTAAEVSSGQEAIDSDSPAECWVCYGDGLLDSSCGGSGSGPDSLIQPCEVCSGSMRYIHRRCFERWLSTSWSVACPNCARIYQRSVLSLFADGRMLLTLLDAQAQPGSQPAPDMERRYSHDMVIQFRVGDVVDVRMGIGGATPVDVLRAVRRTVDDFQARPPLSTTGALIHLSHYDVSRVRITRNSFWDAFGLASQLYGNDPYAFGDEDDDDYNEDDDDDDYYTDDEEDDEYQPDDEALYSRLSDAGRAGANHAGARFQSHQPPPRASSNNQHGGLGNVHPHPGMQVPLFNRQFPWNLGWGAFEGPFHAAAEQVIHPAVPRVPREQIGRTEVEARRAARNADAQRSRHELRALQRQQQGSRQQQQMQQRANMRFNNGGRRR